ncbi:MAG: DUF2142 domain-containing protein [Acidimicrobiales bacterium]
MGGCLLARGDPHPGGEAAGNDGCRRRSRTYKVLTAGLLALVLIRLLNARISRATGALAVVTVAASVLLVFATLYADWTPIGAPAVAGIQGRYFLPLVPALVAGTGWEVTHIGTTFVWRLIGLVTWLGVAATAGLSQGF